MMKRAYYTYTITGHVDYDDEKYSEFELPDLFAQDVGININYFADVDYDIEDLDKD